MALITTQIFGLDMEVVCISCAWSGLVRECYYQVNEVVICPKCKTPVIRRDNQEKPMTTLYDSLKQLDDKFTEIEGVFAAMGLPLPVVVPYKVEGDANTLLLSYRRSGGSDSFFLCVALSKDEDPDRTITEWIPLINCTVLERIKLIPAIPLLYRKARESLNGWEDEVGSAINKLDKFLAEAKGIRQVG